MENYDRTTELINVATNSAGRSSEQFAKYTDSVENKINKLKNTWEQMRLSFFGSDWYKGILDTFNNILANISQIDGKRAAAIALIGATIGRILVKNIVEQIRVGLTSTAKDVKTIKGNLQKD